MRTIIPSAGTPFTPGDILSALTERGTEAFAAELARFAGVRHAGLTCSGVTAFYLILRALRDRSDRREVVLPAYTAPSLLLPVRQLGLRPVLADVSLKTFNMDMQKAASAAGRKTLAVVAVHMFGIPCDLGGAREAASEAGAVLVEDAAVSLGATVGGRQTGGLGDIGFYSFNRGKNLSTVAGGAWVSADDGLAADVAGGARNLPAPSLFQQTATLGRLLALALVVRPACYTALHPLLGRFKDTAVHADFARHRYTALQAGVGRSCFRRLDRIVAERNARAERAREILAGADGITLPDVPPLAVPAYNQFPLLLPDEATRDRALAETVAAGIECTRLYNATVYQAYHLGPDECGGVPCPRAEDLARRLLLIPCHPLVPMERIEQAAEIARSVAAAAPPTSKRSKKTT